MTRAREKHVLEDFERKHFVHDGVLVHRVEELNKIIDRKSECRILIYNTSFVIGTSNFHEFN